MTSRRWVSAVCVVMAAACAEAPASIPAAVGETRTSAPARPLVQFGEHGRAVLDRATQFTFDASGLVLARAHATPTTPSWSEDERSPVLTETSPRTAPLVAPAPDTIRVPSDARDALVLTFGERAALRVFEEGARGASETIEGTASYAREGGRSYWTEAEGSAGFEEWLEIGAGLAHADHVIARWRVEGHTLREVTETGGVHVLDHEGRALVYVSAPEAWTVSGTRLRPTLDVEDGAIVLRVDALGEPVLVDPMWVPTGELSTIRRDFYQGYGAERLASGRVLIAGGMTGSGWLDSAEQWDLATEVWTSAGTMSVRRARHATGLLLDGRVLATGGQDQVRATCVFTVHASADLYDPSTDTWSAAAPMAQRREFHTQTTLADGTVLVAGGQWILRSSCASPSSSGAVGTAERYDPASNTWSSAGSLATVRYRHTATRLSDGRVLVVGGAVAFSTSHIASAELYDPLTNAWSSAASLAAGRFSHTATLLPDGRVFVAGGRTVTALSSAELYDPATNTWSSAAPMNRGREGHTATLLSDGRVLIAAGDLGLATSEVYDPATNTWSSEDMMREGHAAGHAACALTDGRVLVAGSLYDTGTEVYVPDPECSLDTDCPDDGDLCTAERCTVRGLCERVPIAACCAVDADCADADACTTDACDAATGTCSHVDVLGCCVGDGDCGDGDHCTADSCGADQRCVNDPIAACGMLDSGSGIGDASVVREDAGATLRDADGRPDAGRSDPSPVDASIDGVDADVAMGGDGFRCSASGPSTTPTHGARMLVSLVLLGAVMGRRRRARV